MNNLHLSKTLFFVLSLGSFIFLSCGEPELTFKTKGSLSGTVSDASNGNAISGVTITNSLDSSTTTTDSSGDFSFSSLSPGSHNFSFDHGSYTAQSANFTVESSTITNGNISLLNSTLSTNIISIVLTWGASPEDLDSHLYIPVGGSSTTEILHSSKGDEDRADAPHAYLDVDDTSKYGPETTTIRFNSGATDYNRTYRFFVGNYSQAQDGSSTKFKNSSAVVRFYKNGSLIKTWEAAKTATDIWWHVFDMGSDGTVTSKDTYSSSKPAVLYE